jgi:Tol biopolymer transport system component
MTHDPASRRTLPSALRSSRAVSGLVAVAALVGFATPGRTASERAETPDPAGPTGSGGRRIPSELGLAPDGRRVAFVLEADDPGGPGTRRRIHLWDPEGGPLYRWLKKVGIGDGPRPARHRPVTRDTEDAWAPAFSPDGRRLAFLSARGKGAPSRIWMLPLDGGEADPWTSPANEVEAYAWGPDGEIVYLARDAGPGGGGPGPPSRSFWRVPPGGGPAERLLRADPIAADFVLSPDGRRIAWIARGDGGSAGAELADPYGHDRDTGETRRLVDRPGPERSPRFSPDGDRVFYLAPLDPAAVGSPLQVWEVPFAGGPPRCLTNKRELDVREIAAAPGADRILAVVAEGPDERLARIIPDSRNVYVVHADSGRVSHVASNGDGRKAVFVHAPPGRGPEIAKWAFDDDYIQVLTDLNAEPPTGAEIDALPNANEEVR